MTDRRFLPPTQVYLGSYPPFFMRLYKVIIGTLALLVAQDLSQQAQAQVEAPEADPGGTSPPTPDTIDSDTASHTVTADDVPTAIAPPTLTAMPLDIANASPMELQTFPDKPLELQAVSGEAPNPPPLPDKALEARILPDEDNQTPLNPNPPFPEDPLFLNTPAFDNARFSRPNDMEAELFGVEAESYKAESYSPESDEPEGASHSPETSPSLQHVGINPGFSPEVSPEVKPERVREEATPQPIALLELPSDSLPEPVSPENISFKTGSSENTSSENASSENTSLGNISTRNIPATTVLATTVSTGNISATTILAQAESLTPEEEQRLETLREQYALPELTDTNVLDQNPSGALSSPGSAVGVPSVFGASWRNVFAGLTFQERTRFTDRSDGAMSVGFGLGDAENAVGLEVAIAIVDLLGEGAFEDGSISLKLHRQLGDGWAIAAGIENFATFGSTDGGSSGYGVVTKVTELRDSDQPFNTLTTSLGIGGGRFRPEGRLDQDEINVFGSVAVRMAEPVSLIADWSGQDLNLGVSVVPFKNLPLVVTPAAVDVTGNAGDGVRFTLGLGVGHSF